MSITPTHHLRWLGAALFAIATGCSPAPSDSGVKNNGLASAPPEEVASSTLGPPADSSAALVLAPPPPPPPKEDPNAPFGVIDMHVDTPYQVKFKKRPVSLPEGHATPTSIRAGNYIGITYPIYIPDYLNKNHPTIQDADAILGTIDELLAAHPTLLHDASKGARPDDKVAVYLSIEGAGAFAEDITQIDRFVKRGVRFVGPVHWHDDDLATSATDKGKKKRGLSDLGKDFCRRVYAAGAIVDVSHLSDRGFEDLLPIAKEFNAPIVATHSNARVIADHPRNLTDDQLRVIRDTGGVAGLNLYSGYVHLEGKPSLEDVIRHVEHMVKVAGADHVGIGSDYDGGKPPDSLADASKWPVLAEALMKRGMSRDDVRKIFGKNVLRVLEWKPKA